MPRSPGVEGDIRCPFTESKLGASREQLEGQPTTAWNGRFLGLRITVSAEIGSGHCRFRQDERSSGDAESPAAKRLALGERTLWTKLRKHGHLSAAPARRSRAGNGRDRRCDRGRGGKGRSTVVRSSEP